MFNYSRFRHFHRSRDRTTKEPKKFLCVKLNTKLKQFRGGAVYFEDSSKQLPISFDCGN